MLTGQPGFSHIHRSPRSPLTLWGVAWHIRPQALEHRRATYPQLYPQELAAVVGAVRGTLTHRIARRTRGRSKLARSRRRPSLICCQRLQGVHGGSVPRETRHSDSHRGCSAALPRSLAPLLLMLLKRGLVAGACRRRVSLPVLLLLTDTSSDRSSNRGPVDYLFPLTQTVAMSLGQPSVPKDAAAGCGKSGYSARTVASSHGPYLIPDDAPSHP